MIEGWMNRQSQEKRVLTDIKGWQPTQVAVYRSGVDTGSPHVEAGISAEVGSRTFYKNIEARIDLDTQVEDDGAIKYVALTAPKPKKGDMWKWFDKNGELRWGEVNVYRKTRDQYEVGLRDARRSS